MASEGVNRPARDISPPAVSCFAPPRPASRELIDDQTRCRYDSYEILWKLAWLCVCLLCVNLFRG
jgi:hypothetical protein